MAKKLFTDEHHKAIFVFPDPLKSSRGISKDDEKKGALQITRINVSSVNTNIRKAYNGK